MVFGCLFFGPLFPDFQSLPLHSFLLLNLVSEFFFCLASLCNNSRCCLARNVGKGNDRFALNNVRMRWRRAVTSIRLRLSSSANENQVALSFLYGSIGGPVAAWCVEIESIGGWCSTQVGPTIPIISLVTHMNRAAVIGWKGGERIFPPPKMMKAPQCWRHPKN